MEIYVANRTANEASVDKTRKLIAENFAFGQTKIDGEADKSLEQLELIARVNHAFRSEFHDLAIAERFRPLNPNSVHFLPGKVYEEILPNAKGPALCIEDYDAIIINQASIEEDKRFGIFTLLHESAHRWSYTQFVYNPQRKLPEVRFGGFRVTRLNETSYLFPAIDEAMSDLSAQTIQYKNFELFFGEDSTPEAVKPQIGSYFKEMKLLQEIIEKVSEVKHEDIVKTWVRFCRGYYAGERVVLKDIDLAMGAGYVKHLAGLEPDRSDYKTRDL